MEAGRYRGTALAALGLAFALATGGPAAAQDSTNVVATQTDWSVFVEESPRECWAVSAPKETVNTRNGQTVAVRRGDIRFFVAFRPGGARGEVAFTGGYPFAPQSTATVQIGNDRFELFTDGEWAWPASPEDDRRLVEAMRRGQQAIVTARSARGTQTRDTFSLLGFTAATAEAERRCPPTS
jgi:invasion protein IalB